MTLEINSITQDSFHFDKLVFVAGDEIEGFGRGHDGDEKIFFRWERRNAYEWMAVGEHKRRGVKIKYLVSINSLYLQNSSFGF